MKTVLVLLAQGFEEYEAGVFTNILAWSRDIRDFPVQVPTAGRGAQMRCAWNFTVQQCPKQRRARTDRGLTG